MMDDRLPTISVIIPVLNEEAFIERTVSQLLAQDYPRARVEVIVADGGSTDATREIVSRLATGDARLRLVDNPGRLSSAGRNAGIRASSGEYVVIVDGHCFIEETTFLRELAGAFERSGADCLGRPQPQDVQGTSALQQAIAFARASALGHHAASFIYADEERLVPAKSVAVAYKAAVFEAVGVFDESFDACEDVELNHRVDRAGMKCFFTPRVRVRYFPRATLRGLYRQLQRYGRGRVRLLRKHPETFSLASFLPAVLLAGIFAGPLLAWAVPVLWPVYFAAVGLYLTLVLLFSLAITIQKRRLSLLPWLPLVYFAIHAGAGSGVLKEALLGPPAHLRGRGEPRAIRGVPGEAGAGARLARERSVP